MRTLAIRMETEQVWDQSAYSQEGIWPAYSGNKHAATTGRKGSRVSVQSPTLASGLALGLALGIGVSIRVGLKVSVSVRVSVSP